MTDDKINSVLDVLYEITTSSFLLPDPEMIKRRIVAAKKMSLSDKKFRLLGFIQGQLHQAGLLTVEDCMRMNMPEGEEFDPDRKLVK